MIIIDKLVSAAQVIKNNPWKSVLGLTGTIIFSLLGAAFSDARYVRQSEDIAYKIQMAAIVKQLTETITLMEAQIIDISKGK